MRAILDSGPLIAAWNKDDTLHLWSEKLFKTYSGPFYVTEPILTEVAHLTGRDRTIVEGLKNRRFLLVDTLLEQIPYLEWCLGKWTHCDLADAMVMRPPSCQASGEDLEGMRDWCLQANGLTYGCDGNRTAHVFLSFLLLTSRSTSA